MNLNATLIVQIVVFLAFVLFTMKFVWPPITQALDERAKKITEGLAAADKAKTDLKLVEQKVSIELRKARENAAEMQDRAEKQAELLVEEARTEAGRIVAAARLAAEAEADIAIQRAKEDLREQVALLAVAGAEKILRKEVNAQVHAELLSKLKAEL